MKIAVVKPGVAASNTAFEAMALLYTYCRRRGAEVELFIDESDKFRSPELPITRLNGWIPPKWLKRIGFPLGPFYTSLRKTGRDYDVVIGTDPFLYYHKFLGGYWLSQSCGAALIVDVSLTFILDETRPVWRSYLKRGLGRHWSRSICRFLATTPDAVARLEELGVVDSSGEGRARVLGHPVDASRFRPGERDQADGVEALSVGRLVEEKGHVDLVRLLHPVFEEYPGFSLSIVGAGPQRTALEESIERLGLKSQVKLHGEVEHGKLPPYYRRADIFVAFPKSTPRWEEFFGVVYVEAMSSGLPIVTTDCGGIRHVVQAGEVGYVVPEGDEDAFQRMVCRLLESSALRREMGKAGRKRALEKFSVNVLGERFYQICRGASEARA